MLSDRRDPWGGSRSIVKREVLDISVWGVNIGLLLRGGVLDNSGWLLYDFGGNFITFAAWFK